MKKSLLSLLALSASLFAGASAPQLMWHKIIDSPQNAGDIMKCTEVTADGNIVTLGCFGSRTDADNISFDGQVIATGAATNSASDNLNLLAIKHRASDGSRIWSISSRKGDFASMGAMSMTATADGGVAMLIEMRSSNVTPYESPVIIDASGAEIDFPDWNVSCWISYQVLVKLSADGNVQWIRPIIADQLPVPNASSGTSTLYTVRGEFPYAIAEDSQGNLYIGGNFRTPMIFNGAGNATYVLQPRNLESYNGDTQNYAGALYLVKLDSEGNYLSHLRTSSDDGVSSEFINDMAIDGDNLYFAGYFQGKADCKLTIGSGASALTLTKSSADNAVMVGAVKISAENNLLTPSFITCYNEVQVSGKSRIQFQKMTAANGSLYIMGLFQGAIAANGSEEKLVSSVNTMLEGFCLRLDATDGKFAVGYANQTSIGGYLNGFFYNDRLYLTGYRLNAQTGSFIDEFNPETLEKLSTTTVAKAGGAPTLTAAAFNPANSCIYTLTRGSAAFTLTDDSATEKQSGYGFGTVFCSHAIDPTLTAIDDVAADNATFSASGFEGAIEVTASEETDVTVVDLKGIVLDSRTVQPGKTVIALPAGIYVVNNIKVAVR